jgi:MFS family permease
MFVSASILAGAIAQLPIGYISDRVDRRWVVIAIAIVALCSDAAFVAFTPQTAMMAALYSAVFGAAIFTFYPVLVAHANDHAEASEGLQTSGGLLLMLGLGSMVGPIIGGVLMSLMGPHGLFVSTSVAHSLILVFALWRLTQRDAVHGSEKGQFIPIAPMRTRTPQTIVLAEPEDQDS